MALIRMNACLVARTALIRTTKVAIGLVATVTSALRTRIATPISVKAIRVLAAISSVAPAMVQALTIARPVTHMDHIPTTKRVIGLVATATSALKTPTAM